MDTTPPFAVGSDYAGLKDELQKIAGIIEQYPDQLKHRAFELLINAYLGRNIPAEVAAPANPESKTEAGASVEEVAKPESEILPALETIETVAEADPYSVGTESESPLGRADDTAANLLRKRIRLRSMSQVRWQTQSPV